MGTYTMFFVDSTKNFVDRCLTRSHLVGFGRFEDLAKALESIVTFKNDRTIDTATSVAIR